MKELDVSITHDKDDNLTVQINFSEGNPEDLLPLFDKIKEVFYDHMEEPKDVGYDEEPEEVVDEAQENIYLSQDCDEQQDGDHYIVGRQAHPTSRQWNKYHVFKWDTGKRKFYPICNSLPGLPLGQAEPFRLAIGERLPLYKADAHFDYVPVNNRCKRCMEVLRKM